MAKRVRKIKKEKYLALIYDVKTREYFTTVTDSGKDMADMMLLLANDSRYELLLVKSYEAGWGGEVIFKYFMKRLKRNKNNKPDNLYFGNDRGKIKKGGKAHDKV